MSVRCPWCGRLAELRENALAYHDIHPNCRQLCPASRLTELAALRLCWGANRAPRTSEAYPLGDDAS